MAPRTKAPPGEFLTAFPASGLAAKGTHPGPEYTALHAYSSGWVYFGLFPLLSPWGHLVKQFSVWLWLTKISALLVWERAISIKLIKYTYYLSFVRQLPREMY